MRACFAASSAPAARAIAARAADDEGGCRRRAASTESVALMVYPVYEPPAQPLTAAESAMVEKTAEALLAKVRTAPAAPADAAALAEACRGLPPGYSKAGSKLVHMWVEAECARIPCGTLKRPGPDIDPGGCFSWRVEAAAVPPVRPLQFDRLQPVALHRQPVTLTGEVFWVGRGDTCDLVVGGRLVSSRHASLRRPGTGEVFILDHSTNGTFLNGRRLNKGVEERITAGDQIEFGCTGGVEVGSASYIFQAGCRTGTSPSKDAEEQALLDKCWAALQTIDEARRSGNAMSLSTSPTILAEGFMGTSDQTALSVISQLYRDVIRQVLRIESFVWVLYSCVPPATRVLFETSALVTTCAARRSPINSNDYQVLASRHYCEICHQMDEEQHAAGSATIIKTDGITRAVLPCGGCGVAAYCCPDHAREDADSHSPWCKTLLLSRLLWQCALPTDQYERLRRGPPSSDPSFCCLGRPVGPNGPSRLPHWPAFWLGGWVGYFEAAREFDEGDVEAGMGRLGQILSTDSLSSILTVRYALHKLGLDREPSLTIYLLGAVFEASQPWVELLAWLPDTHAVTLVLTGPDITSAPPATTHFKHNHPDTERRLSTSAGGQSVQLTIHSINGLYHWLTTAQRDSIPQPDVVFALHSGMNEYVSWTPTVRQLLDRNKTPPGATIGTPNETPFVVTAWTPPEAVRRLVILVVITLTRSALISR